MKGKNGTTSFLPERRKGGKVRFSEEITYIPNKERTCLTKDQAIQVYAEIEKNELINIQIVSPKVKQEQIKKMLTQLKIPIKRPLQISILKMRVK